MPPATWENTSPRRPPDKTTKTPFTNRRARAREGSATEKHSMNYKKLRRKALASRTFGKLLAVARLPELKIVKTAGFIASCIL